MSSWGSSCCTWPAAAILASNQMRSHGPCRILLTAAVTLVQVQPGDLFVCIERDARDGHADAAEVRGLIFDACVNGGMTSAPVVAGAQPGVKLGIKY